MSITHFSLKIQYVFFIFILALKNQSTWSQERIIGGKAIAIRKVPYVLFMVVGDTSICGASIIGRTWGLTAAHCFLGAKGKNVYVVSGTANLVKRDKTARIHLVTRYRVHEKYVPFNNTKISMGNDIAVFTVFPPFEFNSNSWPVRLPSRWRRVDESEGLVAGWGLTKPKGNASTILNYVILPKINTNVCKAFYLSKSVLLARRGEICYGFLDEKITKDSCEGDSGGALVNKYGTAIGVVSWGPVDCGKYPGVYAEILYYRNWIRRNTGI